MLQPENVTVDLRLASTLDGKTKAFADVTLDLGPIGAISMNGFSVVGDNPRVVPPARKGAKQYFDVVILTGKVKTLVCTMIGMAYKKAVAESRGEAK